MGDDNGKFWKHNLYTINYCSGPTGSGKTYALQTRINDLIKNGQTVILAQPTKLLAEQTKDEISDRFPSIHVEVINQDTCNGSVTAYCMGYLARPYDQPHLIIVTWAGFIRLPMVPNRDRFHLICDEVPDGFVPESIRLPDNHKMITEAFDVEQIGPMYGLIKVKDPSLVRKLAENKKKDKGTEIVSDLASRLIYGKYVTYVKMDAYDGLINGSSNEHELTTFSLISSAVFEGFRSVTLIGARAEETILFKWLSSISVTFMVDDELTGGLRYQEHENGHLIDFYYASEGNWSFDRQTSNPLLRPLFEQRALELFNGSEFSWQDNKRNEGDSLFGLIDGAHMLSHAPHGMNNYQSINNAVILTARNYSSEQSGFLTNFCGIDREAQRVALAYHSAYQTYNRISTRDPSNNDRKTIVLPDRQNAAWQHELFPGSTLNSLGIDTCPEVKLGRKRIHVTDTARKQASRDRIKKKQQEGMNRMISAIESHEDLYMNDDCDVSSFNNIGHFVTRLQGSLIAHKLTKSSTGLLMDKQDFVNQMRQFSHRNIKSKEDAMLISPALFEPVAGLESRRSLVNAVVGKNVILDIENGSLKFRDFIKIFPKMELIVYSSFNHTTLNPRYRVIFLTDSVLTPDAYKILYHQIIQRIEVAGYENGFNDPAKPARKAHGIDYKPSVSDLFYLPSQPREGKGFFQHYHKGRLPLNVQEWLDHLIPTRFYEAHGQTHESTSQLTTLAGDDAAVCEKALQVYRDQTIASQTGNKAMFKLNSTLIREGVDWVERKTTLTLAAAASRSPRDRLKDVERLMARKGSKNFDLEP